MKALGHRFVAAPLALILILSSCSGGDRPAAPDWQPLWAGVTDALPSLTSLGDPPDRDICGPALGVLRASRPDVLPTPDLALDGVVTEWFTIAEDALFECPPSSHEIPDLASAYEELARLQAEVDAVLRIDLSTG